MEKLASYLRAHDLKQKEFASMVGVTEGAVSQWLAGGNISLKRLARIHAVTGIPVHDLAPQLFSLSGKTAGKAVRSRSQTRIRRLREPANA
jgi:transcriptional regulator with XRE-family HTH domain